MKKLVLAAAISALFAAGSAMALDTSSASSTAGVNSMSASAGLFSGVTHSGQATQVGASNSSAAGVSTVDHTALVLTPNPVGPGYAIVPVKIDQVVTNASSVGGTYSNTQSTGVTFFPLNGSFGSATQGGNAGASGNLN